MMANLVNQKASSVNPQEVLLQQVVPGYVAVSSVFSNGDSIYYSIEDGKNKEVGLAVYSTADNKLIKTAVFDKIDNLVYTQNPGTGLTLSENARVTVSASIQALTSHLPSWKRLEPNSHDSLGDMYLSMPIPQLLTAGIILPYFESTPAQEQSIPLLFTVPFDIKQDSSMYLTLSWLGDTNQDAVVKWDYEYTVLEDNQPFSSVVTLDYQSNSPIVANSLRTSEFLGINSMLPGSVITGRLYRDASNAIDNYPGNAGLISAEIVYQKDRVGTPNRTGNFYDWAQ